MATRVGQTPSRPGAANQLVLSIHRLTDTVVYGHDLAHYINEEFRKPKVTAPFWRDYV